MQFNRLASPSNPSRFMSSSWYFIIVPLLLSAVRGGHAEEDNVPGYRIRIQEKEDLVLLKGDNPCKVIKHYCESAISLQLNRSSCTTQLQTSVLLHLIDTWGSVHEQLIIDESLFIDCEQYFTCADTKRAPLASLIPNRRCVKTSGVVEDTLSLLDRASHGDAAALTTFKKRRNEALVKLSDHEKHEFYRRAILLLPNNSCIVDQFGLTLLYLGREDLARKVYGMAVNRQLWSHPLQRPLFQSIPWLKSKPFPDKKDFEFIKILEGGYPEMKEELLHNLAVNGHLFGIEEWNINVSVGGNWTELRLKSPQGFEENSKLFPKTLRYIKACHEEFVNIKFSALTPGTHIRPHTGPSNALLRSHLTLLHTGGARMRVGTEWYHFEEGKAMVFDSSWEHEVYHDGDDIRVVLMLDIWHPSVPDAQRVSL